MTLVGLLLMIPNWLVGWLGVRKRRCPARDRRPDPTRVRSRRQGWPTPPTPAVRMAKSILCAQMCPVDLVPINQNAGGLSRVLGLFFCPIVTGALSHRSSGAFPARQARPRGPPTLKFGGKMGPLRLADVPLDQTRGSRAGSRSRLAWGEHPLPRGRCRAAAPTSRISPPARDRRGSPPSDASGGRNRCPPCRAVGGLEIRGTADWKSALQLARLVVAQVSNLPCRRLPAGRPVCRSCVWRIGNPRHSRLEVCATVRVLARLVVAQVSNLPCRRLPAGRPVCRRAFGGLEIRDTADWKSAPRARLPPGNQTSWNQGHPEAGRQGRVRRPRARRMPTPPPSEWEAVRPSRPGDPPGGARG